MSLPKLMKRDDGCVYPYHPLREKRSNFRIMTGKEVESFLKSKGKKQKLTVGAISNDINLESVKKEMVSDKIISDEVPQVIETISAENNSETKSSIIPEITNQSLSSVQIPLSQLPKSELVRYALEKHNVKLDVSEKRDILLKKIREMDEKKC